jgi:hypothetical protein
MYPLPTRATTKVSHDGCFEALTQDAQAKLSLTSFGDPENKHAERPGMPRQGSSYNEYKRSQQFAQLSGSGFGDKEELGFTESTQS